tara:strand:- start:757 stop:882 length:126 start_codon:yes stop_codon:yes gene_type:complete
MGGGSEAAMTLALLLLRMILQAKNNLVQKFLGLNAILVNWV